MQAINISHRNNIKALMLLGYTLAEAKAALARKQGFTAKQR